MFLCGVLQGDRMWRFAVGLYLVYLSGGELRLAAIFGFSAGGAIILFGGMIGNWVDNNSRLKGNCDRVFFMIVGNRFQSKFNLSFSLVCFFLQLQF